MKSENGKFLARLFFFTGVSAVAVVLFLTPGCGGDVSPEALAGRGETALRQTRYELAARHFRRALRYAPDSLDLRYNLATAYWKMGDIDAAVEELDQSLAIDPGDRSARLLKGHLLLRQHDWDAARKVFEEGIDIFGMEPESLTGLALAEIGAGRYALARLYLRDALEIDPEYPPALYNLGSLFRDHLEQPSRAIETFNRFRDVADDPDHLSKAFDTLERLRKISPESAPPSREPPDETPDRARPAEPSPPAVADTEAEENAVAAPGPSAPRPSQARELVEQARLAINNDRPLEKVLSLLKRAVEADPGDPEAQWQLARVYDRHGLQTRAMQHYQRFRERFPDDPRVGDIPSNYGLHAEREAARRREAREELRFNEWIATARKHYNAKRWNEAVHAYRQAIELRPDSAEAHYNLGFAYKAAGDLSQADTAYARAREIDPDDPRFAYVHSMLLRELGRLDRAAAIMDPILRKNPDFAKGFLLMAYIRWDQKRYDEVRVLLTRYLALDPPDEQRRRVENWLSDIP